MRHDPATWAATAAGSRPIRSRVPRKDLETVRSATPQLVVVKRVLEGCHSPWQGKRRGEHATGRDVRLPDRDLVEVPMVAILFFIDLIIVAKRSENSINPQGRGTLDWFGNRRISQCLGG